MAGFFLMTGGIAAFAAIFVIMDYLAQRQDRQRALKDKPL